MPEPMSFRRGGHSSSGTTPQNGCRMVEEGGRAGGRAVTASQRQVGHGSHEDVGVGGSGPKETRK